MGSNRLVVIEINEIPLSLMTWFAQREPKSTVATLLQQGSVGQTQVFEEADRELYPSQTWATLATGVAYEKHGIYWYGDPKPAEFPLYWQEAAKHRSVGILGTLHSSPLAQQGTQPGLRFAVPDPFASDAATFPRSLEALQRFNLSMTQSNSRAVASRFPAADYLRGLAVLPGSGVRPATLTRLTSLAAQVASGRVPKERLRSAQFVLMADVFHKQMREHDPDLGVFFTNHVASSMHRYWPASFPADWDPHPYDEAWIERFDEEIPFAMAALDRFLGEVWAMAKQTDRTLVMFSSMGQEGGGPVDEGGPQALVIDDGRLLASKLGVTGSFDILQAMAPHLTLRFDDAANAVEAENTLAAVRLDDRPLVVHRAEDTVTITYHLGSDTDTVKVNGNEHNSASLGFRTVEVSEHKAGRHMPYGLMLCAAPGGNQAPLPAEPVDLVEVAPALLAALGLPPLPHHSEPSFKLG